MAVITAQLCLYFVQETSYNTHRTPITPLPVVVVIWISAI